MAKNAAKVCERFTSEQDYIQRYVQFLLSRSSFSDGDVINLSMLLQKHGLPKLKYRTSRQMMNHFPGLSPKELARLAKCIDSYEIPVKVSHAVGEEMIRSMPHSKIVEGEDGASITEEEIEKLDLAMVAAEAAEDEMQAREPLSAALVERVGVHIRSQAAKSMDWPSPETNFSSLSGEDAEQVAIEAVRGWLLRRMEELEKIQQITEEVRVITRAAAHDSEILTAAQRKLHPTPP